MDAAKLCIEHISLLNAIQTDGTDSGFKSSLLQQHKYLLGANESASVGTDSSCAHTTMFSKNKNAVFIIKDSCKGGKKKYKKIVDNRLNFQDSVTILEGQSIALHSRRRYLLHIQV